MYATFIYIYQDLLRPNDSNDVYQTLHLQVLAIIGRMMGTSQELAAETIQPGAVKAGRIAPRYG